MKLIRAKYHGGRQSRIDRIVLHSTVSRTVDGGAESIARYFQNPTYVSSAHYVTDPSNVVQCVPDDTIAWHDGTNTNSIGVEMCDDPSGGGARWSDDAHRGLLRTTASLVRDLCRRHSIPMRRLTPAQVRAGHRGICGHDTMRDAFPGSTSHWDPGEFPWAEFIGLVNGSTTPKPSRRNAVANLYTSGEMPMELKPGRHAASFGEIPPGVTHICIEFPKGTGSARLILHGDKNPNTYKMSPKEAGVPDFDWKLDKSHNDIDRLRPWRVKVPEGATGGAVYWEYDPKTDYDSCSGSLTFRWSDA